MSHHLDTPLAAQNGQLYIDDLYVFPGQGSTVLIMDVNSNVNGLHSEPGFHLKPDRGRGRPRELPQPTNSRRHRRLRRGPHLQRLGPPSRNPPLAQPPGPARKPDPR